MTENGGDDAIMGGSMTTMAFSERDLAEGVTNWMLANFRAQLSDAVRSTPFSVPLLCAIACREAGSFWLPLTPSKSAAEILGLCVYDASGDVAGAPRSAFPINTAQFRLSYGDDFTGMLVDEANRARAARGLRPAAIVYKGYGIFQYDLQYVRTDEAFFRSKQWYSFSECVARAVGELKKKYEATGDIQEAVRAYNGSGPKAEQYAQDVMRLLPFCEEAAASAPARASAMPRAAAVAAVLPDSPHDDDPAYPADGEISETADLETARLLANLGAPGEAAPIAPAAPLAAFTTLAFDLARAQGFLEACRTSMPRVTYGLGKKVPFLGAVPGKDFTRVDCSGFVREAIRLSTNPAAPFPDGSVVQHDWIRDHGFEKATIADGLLNDDVVRVAFLRPQDSRHGIGHVALISRAKTLESHGGVGPDARRWDGSDWQAKAFVYVLARGAQLAMAASVGRIAAAEAHAAGVTVRHGRRYRATISLSGFEQFASNDLIAGKLTQVGFTNVVVTGSGGMRQAEASWGGADTTAQLDPHLTGVVELPPGAAADLSLAAIAAPAVTGKAHPMGNISANVFSTQSLPTHHEGLLAVKLRSDAMTSGPAIAAAMAVAPTTVGLSALAFYERAGMIKNVVRLRKHQDGAEFAGAPPRLPALAAMMHTPEPVKATDPGAGVSFVELERGQDVQQLQNALANDPNVLSVSRVPARYLVARPPTRKSTAESGMTAAAVPPQDSALWNLKKILWTDARGLPAFQEAEDVKVAVLDTGVDDQHPDLRIDAYHWQNTDLTTPVSNRDIVGHGTHVSGTIAAVINNQIGVNGICRCRLSVWKIFGDETLYLAGQGAFMYTVDPILYRRALIGCIEDAVDVVNLSIGGPAAPDSEEQSLFDQLLAGGTTICAAMGNDRQNGSPTSYPGAIAGVIAVGATGIDDRVTVFSNRGNHIAVAAPGKAIWSTLPSYEGQTGFWAEIGPDGRPREGKPMRRDVNYDAWDGTSMATPHVSGCSALIIAKARAAGARLTPDQVRQALMANADKVPDMKGAPFSTDYGAGRINLFALLR